MPKSFLQKQHQENKEANMAEMEDSAQKASHIEFWIRAIVGLFYVRKTVKEFILAELEKQFDKMSKSKCANCKGDIFCKKCCQKLIGSKCNKQNNISDAWAIAKAILDTGKGYSYSTAESVDVAGYLQILKFCDFITKSDSQNNNIKKVREVRNELAHSPDFTLKKNEMKIMLTKMIEFVKSFQQFSQDVQSELEHLQSETYDTQNLLTGVNKAMTEIVEIIRESSLTKLVSKIKEIQGVTSKDTKSLSEKLHEQFILMNIKILKDLNTNKEKRHRQMKWEQQQEEQLLSEICSEYKQVSVIKAREVDFSCELGSRGEKKTEFFQKMDQDEIGYMDYTRSIKSMRETADKKMSEIKVLKNELLVQELNHQHLQEARKQLEITAQSVLQTNPFLSNKFYEIQQAALQDVESKKISVNKLKEDLEKIGKNTESKLEQIDESNLELEKLNMKMSDVLLEMTSLQQQQQRSKQAKTQKESALKQKAEQEKQAQFREDCETGKKREGSKKEETKPQQGAKQSPTKQTGDVAREAFNSESVNETRDDIWINVFASQADKSSTQYTNVTVSEQRTEMVTSLIKVIKCANINTRDLYDGAYLPDGRLVVTDYSRNELLLFDDSVTLQAQYDVERGPCGVCVSADGSLIYVVHYDGTLVTYRLQGGLEEVSHVKVQMGTTGVGVSGDTIITGHDDNITLYNMKGRKLSSISKELYPTCICVSRDGSRFYHRDGDHIVCRTVSDLSEVFRYSHPKLRDPWGIACDRHGNILVAGLYSGNIIMIDKDGTQGRVLMNKLHGIRYPSGVCCHPQRDEFVVLGFVCKENDNAMEVYEI